MGNKTRQGGRGNKLFRIKQEVTVEKQKVHKTKEEDKTPGKQLEEGA